MTDYSYSPYNGCTIEYLRTELQSKRNAAIESFNRSDTDGCVSQWASGVTASEIMACIELAENGGMAVFPALFDLNGDLVAAKLVDGKFGPVWGILESDDPSSRITSWVSAFPKRESTMTRKGYREGKVRTAAAVFLAGSGTGLSGALSVRPVERRTDRGFSRSVEIVDNGL